MVTDLASLIPALQMVKKSLTRTEPLDTSSRRTLLAKLAGVWGQASDEELERLATESNLGKDLVRQWDFIGAREWLQSFIHDHSTQSAPTDVIARGVISLLQPRFNGPRLLIERLAPAFLAGNSLVIKMSSKTPTASTLIERWIREAGISEEFVAVVGGASSEYGHFLLQHPAISAVSAVGRRDVVLSLNQAASASGRSFQAWCGGRASLLQLEILDFEGWTALLSTALREGRGQRPYDNLRVFILEKDEAAQQAALTAAIDSFKDVGARLSTHLTQCSEDHQAEALGNTVLLLSIKYPFDLAKWVNNASTGFAVRINGPQERIEKLFAKLDVGMVLGNQDFDPKQPLLFGCKESVVGPTDLNPWGAFLSQRRVVRV